MNIQDKIGRDQYEEMKAMFTLMFNGDQAKVDIMMNTKMAQFFKGRTTERSYTWTPVTGKTAGIPRTSKYSLKLKRDNQTSKLLLSMELDKLKVIGIVTTEEFDNIKAMMMSPDEENLIVAEQVINQLRDKRLKKEKAMSKKLGVALINELCPVCTKKMENGGTVVMNTRLTESAAKKVEEMHNQNVWSKELCDECKEMKSKGFILIGAVEAKTTDATNPYRSGNIWCVKQEVAEQLFAPHGAPKSGIAFVDVTVAAQMELPGVNLNA